MKNEFFWLAAAVAVATACSQSTAQQITTLPIELTNSKYPIPTVNVEVDGHLANLVLDTGAAGFSLTQVFCKSNYRLFFIFIHKSKLGFKNFHCKLRAVRVIIFMIGSCF